ncbi:FAD-binding protein [Pantoea tagorei]
MSIDAQRYPLRNTTLNDTDDALWNWAQNAQVGSRQQLHQPRSEAALQQLLRDTQGRVRVIGSRLSPGRMLNVDRDDVLVDISALSGILAHDSDSVTVAAGTTLNELYIHLTALDRMLAASPGVIAVQKLAGAMATGTHGQGLHQSSLADEALRIRMVLADGSIREFTRGEPDFPAAQVTLGALGIVTAVTLRTQPFRIYTCHKKRGVCGQS